jgi:hypothetical protein
LERGGSGADAGGGGAGVARGKRDRARFGMIAGAAVKERPACARYIFTSLI